MNIGFWYCNVNSGNQGWSIYSLYTRQAWQCKNEGSVMWDWQSGKKKKKHLEDSWSTDSLLQKFRDLLLDCLLVALNQCED